MATIQEVHVLLVSLHLQGHLNPMLRFAKCLLSKGIHVTLATTEVARHHMHEHKNATAAAATTNDPSSLNFEFVSDGLSLNFDRNNNLQTFLDAIETTATRNLSTLITNLSKKKKISCIIVNPFWPWVIDVATKHKVPCALLWIQACALYSIYYYYFKDPTLFPNLEQKQDEIIDLPGLPPLKVRDLPSFILPPRSPITQVLFELFQRFDNIKCVLGTSFYELEKEIVTSLAAIAPIHNIGPLVSPFLLEKEDGNPDLNIDLWNVEDSCIEWLDKHPPCSVIYISFGSIILLSQKQMDSIAMGLKNSKKPFLWVVKPPEKGPEHEGAEFPLGFLEETKEKGLIVKWCNQEKVLKHQAIACFLTHCGWNSTLETVVCGVTVIAYPEWSDQPTNAKLLSDVFKVGVRMRNQGDPDHGVVSSREEVERCIVEVIDGPNAEQMKKRALELKGAAKKAVDDGGSSALNLDFFLSQIVNP